MINYEKIEDFIWKGKKLDEYRPSSSQGGWKWWGIGRMSNISIGFWEPPAHSKYGDDLILKPCSQICRPPPPSNYISGQKEEAVFGGKSPQWPSGLLSAPFLSCISEMPQHRSRLSLLEEGSSGDTGDGWQVRLSVSTANCTQIKHIWLWMILPFQSFRASSYEDKNMRHWIYVYYAIIR